MVQTTASNQAHIKGRVLIIDDEPVLRAMASSMLSSNGWEVFSASSAEEAAQLLKYCITNGIDVAAVITDLIMPGGMSGVDALAILRTIQPSLRVIATSGFLVGHDSFEACKNLGFDDVLPKPYTVDDINAVIDRVLQQGAAR